jgi:hypothetical protein
MHDHYEQCFTWLDMSDGCSCRIHWKLCRTGDHKLLVYNQLKHATLVALLSTPSLTHRLPPGPYLPYNQTTIMSFPHSSHLVNALLVIITAAMTIAIIVLTIQLFYEAFRFIESALQASSRMAIQKLNSYTQL